MATLMLVRGSDGMEGRCDAHCYDARHSQCDCVCGGRNHGKGEQQAIENTRQFAEQMMQEYATTHHLADWKGFVRNNVKQLTLI